VDGEAEKQDAMSGSCVRKWQIMRLAEPGPPGPMSASALKRLGW
jgi:hypothetical protein